MTEGMKVEAHRVFCVRDVVGYRRVDCCPRAYSWKDEVRIMQYIQVTW